MNVREQTSIREWERNAVVRSFDVASNKNKKRGVLDEGKYFFS